MHSFDENETDSVHSLSGNDTYRDGSIDVKGEPRQVRIMWQIKGFLESYR